ncbi:MAG: hypothetical protein KKF62_11585 [Bacteroidetes bacterium]|nr:hypothetical protein [Bacteroidota bacterium]
MKRKLLLISFMLFLISSQIFSIDWNVFILNGHKYVKKQIVLEGETIREVYANAVKQVGYNMDEVYFYTFGGKNKHIETVAFKIFTQEVALIITDSSIEFITKEIVSNHLSDFDYSFSFGDYEIKNKLNDGIKNRSLDYEYLSSVFEISNNLDKSILTIPKIGYDLIFENGILVSYKPSDGLNKSALYWKNDTPQTFELYKIVAQKYWRENSSMVINEINIQADAWGRMPVSLNKDKIIDLFRSPEGTVNYKLLQVVYNNEKITLDEFKLINYGRYELISNFSSANGYKETTYRVDNTFYSFSKNGNFLNSYSSKTIGK